MEERHEALVEQMARACEEKGVEFGVLHDAANFVADDWDGPPEHDYRKLLGFIAEKADIYDAAQLVFEMTGVAVVIGEGA